MTKELAGKDQFALLCTESIELSPLQLENDYPTANYAKLPLSRVSALGTAFEPLASAIQTVVNGSGTASGLYRVTVPSGTHLASFKSGVGNLGTVLNANNQIAGQAVLNPIVCNPAMIFMAATLVSIDKKLDAIQELQREMLDFLVQKERAELRGNLRLLSDILDQYRFNWNNDMFKRNNHIKVLDIRQTAEQKISFYREQISAKIQNRAFFHSDRAVQKQVEYIQASFSDYQTALYTHGFSSFLEVMLMGNFASDYLQVIKKKLEEYSLQYKELYTKSYDQIEFNFDTTFQSAVLKSAKSISKTAGDKIGKISLFEKMSVGDVLKGAGSKIESMETHRKMQQFKKLIERKSSCVRPFIESIETVDRFYNNPISMLFDSETVYLGVSDDQ